MKLYAVQELPTLQVLWKEKNLKKRAALFSSSHFFTTYAILEIVKNLIEDYKSLNPTISGAFKEHYELIKDLLNSSTPLKKKKDLLLKNVDFFNLILLVGIPAVAHVSK